jgi:hypothetical protein
MYFITPYFRARTHRERERERDRQTDRQTDRGQYVDTESRNAYVLLQSTVAEFGARISFDSLPCDFQEEPSEESRLLELTFRRSLSAPREIDLHPYLCPGEKFQKGLRTTVTENSHFISRAMHDVYTYELCYHFSLSPRLIFWPPL